MTKLKLPFVSVVIPCLNGEFLLGAALDSLLAQTYPKSRFEIIVVDDGSTDNTPAVAARYKTVRYIRLKDNMGIALARNAGLEEAKGEIYASFDCDCKAEPDWLMQLVAAYQDERALGVGSKVVEPASVKSLATRYITMCDTLFAPTDGNEASETKRPYQRFIDYLKVRLRTSAPDDRPREVSELYGAGASFRRDMLSAVGGWDNAMTWIEDRDLSQRLREAFPGKPFYIVPKARIVHERGESLRQYLSRPVKRGPANFDFHARNHMLPPIFPFPLFYLVVCLGTLFLSPLAFFLSVLLVPQLLYFWWPYKSLERRQLVLLLFPYIQLLEEGMTIVGLVKGYLRSRKRRRHAEG